MNGLARILRWLNTRAWNANKSYRRYKRRTTPWDRAKLCGLLLFIIGLIYLAKFSPWSVYFTPENINKALGPIIAGWHPWEIMAFIAAYALVVSMFAPQPAVVYMGLVLFGAWGWLWSLCGMVLSAILCYCVGRVFGRTAIEHVLGSNFNVMQRHLREGMTLEWRFFRFLKRKPFSRVSQAFWGAFVLRITSMAFTAVSYLSGVMKVPFRAYVLGTLIGSMLPLFGFILCAHWGVAWIAYLMDGAWFVIGILVVIVPLVLIAPHYRLFKLYLWYLQECRGSKALRDFLRMLQ